MALVRDRRRPRVRAHARRPAGPAGGRRRRHARPRRRARVRGRLRGPRPGEPGRPRPDGRDGGGVGAGDRPVLRLPPRQPRPDDARLRRGRGRRRALVGQRRADDAGGLRGARRPAAPARARRVPPPHRARRRRRRLRVRPRRPRHAAHGRPEPRRPGPAHRALDPSAPRRGPLEVGEAGRLRPHARRGAASTRRTSSASTRAPCSSGGPASGGSRPSRSPTAATSPSRPSTRSSASDRGSGTRSTARRGGPAPASRPRRRTRGSTAAAA